MPEKVSRDDDDEMSTVSGDSEGAALSLPTSPCKVWPDTPPVTGPESAVVPAATLADLPSLGSLGHFAGQCSRCCFYPKGRCQNGYDCRFCHYEHEKRRRKKKIISHGVQVSQEYQNRQQAYELQTNAQQVHQQLGLEPALGFAQPLSQIQPTQVPCQASQPQQVESYPVECWSVEKVAEWLASVELGHQSRNFQEHRITGDVLLELSPGELEEIGIHAVGDKKRFLRAVSQLRSSPPAPPPPLLPPPPMQTSQQGNWCQPAPCWEATTAPPPPPPPYYGFNNCWSSPQHLGQQPFGAPLIA